MLRTPLRRTAAAALAALSLSGLAACGSSNSASDASTSSPTPSDPSSTAATASGAPSGTSTTVSAGGDQIEPAQFVDVFRTALDQATTAHLAISIAGQTGLSMQGVADFSTTPPSMSLDLKIPSSGGTTKMIIAGGSIYINAPELGTKYLKTDLSSLPLTGASGDLFNPDSMLPLLQQGITSASHVGTEDVAGEQLDHYSAVLDGKILAKLSAPNAGATPAPTLPPGAVPATVPLDIYVDGTGLLRKESVDLGSASGSVTVLYDRWGQPVSIKVPPANQIQALPSGAPTH